MKAGTLRTAMAWQRYSVEVSELSGTSAPKYSEPQVIRVDVVSDNGNLGLINGDTVAVGVLKVNTRRHHGIAVQDRITYHGEPYRVVDVIPNTRRNMVTLTLSLENL